MGQNDFDFNGHLYKIARFLCTLNANALSPYDLKLCLGTLDFREIDRIPSILFQNELVF